MAVEQGYRQIASILITYGANVNAQDVRGCTPLHLVTKLSVLKLLLKQPVDACIQNEEGLTPLYFYLKYVSPGMYVCCMCVK